jgi:RNA polymerase sigma-70 factor (ECF subfamily)
MTRQLDVDHVAALLTQVAAGQQNALASLYALTSAEVVRAVTGVLVDAAHAEEVTQEVYLQLWLTAAAVFDPDRGSGRGFVLALARRRAIDRVRSVESARRRDAGWNQLDDHCADGDFLDETISRIQIQAALQALGERAQTIVAVYYQGQSYKEIAQQLGTTVTTVKNRHHKALVALRQLVQS